MPPKQCPSSGAIRARLTSLRKQKVALDATILALERYAAAGSGPALPTTQTPHEPASPQGRHQVRRLKASLCRGLQFR